MKKLLVIGLLVLAAYAVPPVSPPSGYKTDVLYWGLLRNQGLYSVDTSLVATKTDAWKKIIQFVVTDPDELVGDSCLVWANESGYTLTIDSLFATSTTDDYDFTLKEFTRAGAAAGGVIKAVTVADNGTNVFTLTADTPTHGTIETGNGIWFVPSADSTAWVEVLIKGHLN